MGPVNEEIRRRQEERGAPAVDLQLENLQLRQRFDFASREIHPFEQNCPMGLHRLNLPYHGVASGWDNKRRRAKTILICHACWLDRHPDKATLEAIDATP